MATVNALPTDGNTVVHYHMDGTDGSADKQDNAEGTAARDLSENGGNPTSTTGTVGTTSDGAYAFGNTANKSLYTADWAFPTGDFTVEMWVYINNNAPTDSESTYNNYGTAGQRSMYVQHETNSKFSFGVSSDGSAFTNITTTSALSRAAWHYVACVFTASTRMEIFIDGVSDASSTTSIPASCFNGTNAFTIGNYTAFIATAANNFDGNIDELRVSNVARTSTEIYNYYNDIGGGGSASPTRMLMGMGT